MEAIKVVILKLDTAGRTIYSYSFEDEDGYTITVQAFESPEDAEDHAIETVSVFYAEHIEEDEDAECEFMILDSQGNPIEEGGGEKPKGHLFE